MSESSILYHEEFSPRTGGNTLMVVEVRFMDLIAGNTHLVAVDLSVSSGIFGDLAVAEQYANAILEAVRVAREKRTEIGLDDSGNVSLTSKVRNPDFPLSDVQAKVLRAISEDGVIIQRVHPRRGASNRADQRGEIWIFRQRDTVQIRKVHSATFESLRRGKFIQRTKPDLPVERQGLTSYYAISPLGAEILSQYWQEPEPHSNQ